VSIPSASVGKPLRWGIVGGGILGMTLADRLSRAGQRVTLLEAVDHLGGLADAWQLGDVTWDRHYHVTLLSDNHTRQLAAELGLGDAYDWRVTRTGFYTDGRMHSMSNSWEFLKFPPLGLIDKFRLAGTITYASRIKDWKSLENIPVADWLRKLSGRRTFEKIWLPLLKAKLGDNYKQTSAAFIWSTIARMYKARRSGMKREMFGYLRGGYARLLAAFEERLLASSVEVRCNHAVREMSQDDTGRWMVDLHNQPAERFDRVVATIPSGVISKICPQLSERERSRLESIQYQGIVCASLLLKQPLSPYYVTNITDEVPFTAVIEMSALVDREQFGGKSLVYLPKYVPSNDALLAASDEEIRAIFLPALKKMHPHLSDDDVLAFRVSRVKHVVALPTLNYSQQVPATKTSLPGLFVVNSSQIVDGTLNVNETIRLAEESLPTLLASTTAPPPSQESAHAEASAGRELVA
jgi:protoporphyrinogen oxidase